MSITSFRKRLAALLKVKRGVYTGVTDEICQTFNGATIEQIRQNRDMILMNNDAVVIKLRLPDKKQRLSKSDGYRLVYLVMKKLPVVTLLDIYPKRGPQSPWTRGIIIHGSPVGRKLVSHTRTLTEAAYVAVVN